jgi:hypothetical protein
MAEALLTALGLIIGVVATLVGILHDEKPSPTRRVLSFLALLGLGAGLYTTRVQYKGRRDADDAASKAKAQLKQIQDKVGDVAQIDASLQAKIEDLTILNRLGGGRYYVVIATFRKNSDPDSRDFENGKHHLLTLYPDAEANGLLWTAPAPGNPSLYELRFGRNLTPSAAQIFLNLANQGLAKGHALIRRES